MRRPIVHRWLASLAALLFAAGALAENAAPLLEFDSPEQEALYQGLVRELRCTVCQNQTLLDSNAGLAQDLRQNVYRQVRAGATRESVIDFMTNRYGDFVLYRPPLKGQTALLWFGPLLFLVVGGAAVALVLRNQRQRAAQPVVVEPAVTEEKPKSKKRRRNK